MNFSWVIDGRVAGCKGPGSENELRFLRSKGICAIIRMAEQPKISREQVEVAGLVDCSEPVRDFTAPSREQVDRLVHFVVDMVSAGKAAAVSCGAGKGRTGTILACYLVAEGKSADEAIQEVRKKRPGSIETKDHEETVREYERRMKRPNSI